MLKRNLNYYELDLEYMDFIKEMWLFLKIRRKLWLAPIIVILFLIGGLLILAQGSVVSPFIYTLF